MLLIIETVATIICIILGYVLFYQLNKLYNINPIIGLNKIQQFTIVLVLLILNKHILGKYTSIIASDQRYLLMDYIYPFTYGIIFALIPTKQNAKY